MRVAAYNVENMFRRPKAFAVEDADRRRELLNAYTELQELFEKILYTDADKERMLKLLGVLGLRRTDESAWAFLRRRGRLLARPRSGSVEVVASGRADWIGWVELKTEAVNEVATRNIAAVIRDLDAEVLAVVEAESRPALQRFNQEVLRLAPGDDWEESFSERYAHIMLIDGNDDRGIDVGLMTRLDHAIGRMRSHVDDGPWDRPIFSRDCPEYEVTVPDGDPVLLMVNHFKSKGYRSKDGTPPDAKREQQAKRVAEIYAERRAEGSTRIIVAGDLNDTPDSAPLAPLLQQTDLRDASEHENFDFGERRGTYGTGNEQFDYLLLTPELFELMSAGGINRKGVWHGPRVKNPWEMLPTLTREIEAASDHAAIWADLDL